MIRISIYYDGKVVNEFEQAQSDKDITIGRAPGCAIRLDEASVSRLHALIRSTKNGWAVERKASFGAVLLNGEEMENAILQGGEEITIGKFTLRIQIEEGSKPKLNVSSSTSSQEQDSDQEDGRTRITNIAKGGLFRFEPGTANISEFLMEKEIAVFGRGSNCDVVLLEKKASRKHIEIKRQGLSFFVKDLDSANGTTVNGKKISSVELVPGDIIQIGESKIEFTIESKDFFTKQDQFMPVPSYLEESSEASEPYEVANYEMNPQMAQMEEVQAAPAAEPEVEEKSIFKKLSKRFWALPKMQRLIWILVFFALFSSVFNFGEVEKTAKKKTAVKVAPAGHGREFEYLTPQKQKIVKELYDELFKNIQKKEFEKALDIVPKIYDIVDDYKDTKDYKKQAESALARIEEDRLEAEKKKQQEALRKEIEALENKGKIIYEKALQDPRARPELEQAIQDIYSKDPNSRLAGEWKQGIEAQIDSERKAQEAKLQLEAQKKNAELAFDAVVGIFKNDEYVRALAESSKLPPANYNDREYLERVEALKVQIRNKLHSVIDPLLAEATTQSREGGDLVRAKELYMQVLKIDGTNPIAQRGLNSIREVLHMRARRFYSEAVLAESVSDLAEAREKYSKCEKTAPDDDSYRYRCRNKLARFETFGGGTE